MLFVKQFTKQSDNVNCFTKIFDHYFTFPFFIVNFTKLLNVSLSIFYIAYIVCLRCALVVYLPTSIKSETSGPTHKCNLLQNQFKIYNTKSW